MNGHVTIESDEQTGDTQAGLLLRHGGSERKVGWLVTRRLGARRRGDRVEAEAAFDEG